MEVAPGALGLSPDGRFGVMTLWGGRVAVCRDGGPWAVTPLGAADFGYSMPAVAVADARTAFVLAADGRLAAFRSRVSQPP